MAKPFYKLAFNAEQADRWSSRINFTNNMVAGVFTAMLIPVIWFRKFPGLKRFTSKKGRFFWSVGLIFVPTNLVNYYFTSRIGQEITQSYNINLMDFMRYRQTGDITIMNPSVEFAEF